MSSITIDDNNPLIYSSPGGWDSEDNTGDPNLIYLGTLTYSWTSGAYRTIRFTGTSITVMGFLDRENEHNRFPVVAQFAIDGGARTTFSPQAPRQYTKVTYYQSPQLPMGEHVLQITNMKNGDVIELDYFIIYGSSSEAPRLLQSDGSPIPSPAPSSSISTPIATILTFSQSTHSSSSSSLPASDSTMSTTTSDTAMSQTNTILQPPPLTSASSNESLSQTLGSTSIQIGGTAASNPTGAPPVITTYQSTVLNAPGSNSSTTSTAADRRLIAIASCGGAFALLALILAALMLFKRNRRKRQAQRALVVESFPIYRESIIKGGATTTSSSNYYNVAAAESSEKHTKLKCASAAMEDWSVYAQPANSPMGSAEPVPPYVYKPNATSAGMARKGCDVFAGGTAVGGGDNVRSGYQSEFCAQDGSRPSVDLPAYTR